MKHSINISLFFLSAFLFLSPSLGAQEKVEKILGEALVEALEKGEQSRMLEDRLVVNYSYEGLPSGSSGLVAVETFQLELYEVLSWHPEEGRHKRVVNGSLRIEGIATASLLFRANDEQQLEKFLDVVGKAIQMIDRADDIRDDISAQYRDKPFRMDDIEVEVGNVYFYPQRKKVPAILSLDFENESYHLLIGSGVRLNSRALKVLYFALSRFPVFADQFAGVPGEYEDFLSTVSDKLTPRKPEEVEEELEDPVVEAEEEVPEEDAEPEETEPEEVEEEVEDPAVEVEEEVREEDAEPEETEPKEVEEELEDPAVEAEEEVREEDAEPEETEPEEVEEEVEDPAVEAEEEVREDKGPERPSYFRGRNGKSRFR